MNLIQQSIRASLPTKLKNTSSGWISMNAPCCHHRGEKPDNRMRGGILFNNDGFVWHCFNCGFKTGWAPGKSLNSGNKTLMRWLGMPETEITKLSFEALKNKDQVAEVTDYVGADLTQVELPPGAESITYWAEQGQNQEELLSVIDYVLARGLEITDFDWYWSDQAGYKDRIIIPYRHQGKIVGWTARKVRDGKPKYLSSSQPSYVFNLDKQLHDSDYVIVMEGPFDAIAIGGVAILSNEANEAQCQRINNLGKQVILVPDRDKAGLKLIDAAIEHRWSVSLPPWEDCIKDVSDAVKRYGKIYTLMTIIHYCQSNELKIKISKKHLEKKYGS